MAYSSDRNLLVGILALQMDFITRDQLIAGMNAWLLQKSRPLEEILFEQRALSADTLALLQALVNKHLELHGNDPQQSLQALSSIEELRDELQSLADPEVQKTLRFVARSTARIPAEPERFTREIDALCDKFSAALRAGQQPKIEEYLPLLPERAQNELLVELLCEELDWRRRGGELVEPAEYEARFPHQHAQVARAFQMRSDGRLDSLEAGVGRSSGVRERSKGRFRVIRPHAKGGLGEVFVARDTELNREVALKEIQQKFSEFEVYRSRFLLEAEVTGALEHPGIVPVYGLGQYADGRPFYAMRFIQGDSLNEAIAQFHRQHAGAGELTTGEVGVEFRKLLGRFIDVCEAIEYAHSRGVLHRDLKPGNIMLGKYGETLVVDWGLAKVVGRDERYRQEGETTIAPDQGSGSAPTQGAIGTPVYMSPEQAAGRVADLGPATDVYSLGATLYHVLTGRAPFFGNSPEEILRRVQAGDYVKPRALLSQPNSRKTKSQPPEAATVRGIPASLEAICVKAMSLRQEDRYPSVAALAADVERFLADEPVSAMKEPVVELVRRWVKRRQTLVASTAAALLVGLLGLAILAAVVARKNSDLVAANQAESRAKSEAESRRESAERMAEEARRNLYIGEMASTQFHWEANRVVAANELLNRYREGSRNADLRGFEWYYLQGLIHSEMATLAGSSVGTNALVFNKEGTRVASAEFDGKIRIWDPTDGQLLHQFQLPDLPLLAAPADVVFQADGTCLSIEVSDHHFIVRDVATGDQKHTGKIKDVVTSVKLSPRGTHVAVLSQGNRIDLYKLDQGMSRHSLYSASHKLKSLVFSSDGQRLAAVSNQATIEIWDVVSRKSLAKIECANTGDISAVAFSPDNQVLVTGDVWGTLRFWDSAGGEMGMEKAHMGWVHDLAFSEDGRMLASAGQDASICLWDVPSLDVSPVEMEKRKVFRGHSHRVFKVAFSRDGHRLVSSDIHGGKRVWDVASVLLTRNQGSQPNGICELSFSDDGSRVVWASDKVVGIWDVIVDLGLQHTVSVPQPVIDKDVLFPPLRSGVVAKLNSVLLAVCQKNGEATLFNPWTGRVIQRISSLGRSVSSLAIDPNGNSLFVGSNDGSLVSYDLTIGARQLLHRGAGNRIERIAVSPTQGNMAFVDAVGVVRLWDSKTKDSRIVFGKAIQSESNPVFDLVFSPDGSRLAVVGMDSHVRVFYVDKTDECQVLKGHTETVTAVAFSPDGVRLATGSEDHSVKVWDLLTGLETVTLKSLVGTPHVLQFSHDGVRLAAGGQTNHPQIWEGIRDDPRWKLEKQSRCLLKSCLLRGESEKEFLNSIRQNTAFSTEVRRYASDLVRSSWRDWQFLIRQRRRLEAASLNSDSWSIVRESEYSESDYQSALKDAQNAVQLSPFDASLVNTLGVAQYRNQRYEDAVRTLERAELLQAHSFPAGKPHNLVFLAMAHHRLGRHNFAGKLLATVKQLMVQETFRNEMELWNFLDEAEKMLDSPRMLHVPK